MKLLDNEMIIFLKNMKKESGKIEKKNQLYIKILEKETSNFIKKHYLIIMK
tara:strand:+ start:1133 stop:1285 length:153 start_codon:yes stop_codon:yes gene_type:complete